MVQKIIEVVGKSNKSFADAVQNAVKTASKTVRNIKWFTVSEMMGSALDGKVSEFHVTVRLYFDFEE